MSSLRKPRHRRNLFTMAFVFAVLGSPVTLAEEQLTAAQASEAKARQALERAERAFLHANQLGDDAAVAVAQRAIEIARGALANAQAAQLIVNYSSVTGLDEAGLAAELIGRLPQEAQAVQAVFKQLGSEDRDDVAYELLRRTSEESLKAIADDPKGKPLLKQLVEELNSGVITDEEIQQVQRVITHASATHGRLVTEELKPEVQRALENAGATLQPISQGFAGLKFDEHALVIDQMPPGVTPEAFLAEFLKDPNTTVNTYPASAHLWEKFGSYTEFGRRVPEGEPRLGDIYTIDIPLDNGDVILSDKSPSHFTFSTIHTGWSGHGEHPEYGNREFGFERDPEDGSITFYTRGASRPAKTTFAGDTVFGIVGTSPQDTTWKTMMEGLRNTIETKKGKVREENAITFHQDPFGQ